MAITNHNISTSIYQMVLDRLPYIVDDSCDIFDLEIVSVDELNRSIVVAGNQTSYLRRNSVHLLVTPDIQVTVDSFTYDDIGNETTIVFKALGAGQAVVGQIFQLIANYNEQLISRYISQMMYIMQSCYSMPVDEFANETFYSEVQKMVIAELVCYYLVFQQTVANAQGNNSFTSTTTELPAGRKISKAKAGEVDTAWSMFKLSDSGLFFQSAEAMMQGFKANAECYAKQLGCIVQICGGSITCSCAIKTPFVDTPFIIWQDKGSCK